MSKILRETSVTLSLPKKCGQKLNQMDNNFGGGVGLRNECVLDCDWISSVKLRLVGLSNS